MSELTDLDDEYVRCRTLLHAWDEIPAPTDINEHGQKYKEGKSVARLWYRCYRCHTIREEAWSTVTGDLLFRTYHYPADYSMSRLEDMRKEMRVEYLRRLGTAQRDPSRRSRRLAAVG